MKQVLIFLKYHLIEYKNLLLNDKRRAIFWLLLLSSPLIIAGNVFGFIKFLAAALKNAQVPVVLNSMAFGLFVLFGFTASTNFFMTMKLFFGSGYFERMAYLPITSGAMFTVKVLEVISRAALDLLFSIPLIAAIAGAFGVRFFHWPAIAAAVLMLEAVICFFTISLLLVVTRYFSKRAAEAIAWLLNVSFVLLFIIAQNYPAALIEKGGVTAKSLQSFIVFFNSAYFDLLPTKWLVNMIYSFSNGSTAFAYYNFFLLFALFAVSGYTAKRLFENSFFYGWQAENYSDGKVPVAAGSGIAYSHHGIFFTLLKRETLTVLRTNQILYSIFIMPAVFFIFTGLDISFGNMSSVPFLLFTIYISCLNSTLFAFGLEGAGIIAFRSLPFSPGIIFRVKYLVFGGLNFFIMALCFAFASSMKKLPLYADGFLLFAVFAFFTLWMNLLVLDFGFCFANFKQGQKLKDAVSMEGTFGLIGLGISAFSAAAYAIYLQSLPALACVPLAVLVIQFFVHKKAFERYIKGDF